MYHLYYLRSSIDDKIYIGITNNPDRRYYEHINYTVEKNHYNGNWIRKTLKKGGEIKMEIALSNLTKKVAIELEIKMIALLKKLTPKKVTNTADGGLGFNHKGIPHSEEHKRALERAQPHKVRIPKETLYDLYVNKKLSKKKIGEIYSCGATTIDRRLKEYGINARRTPNYKASYKLDDDLVLDMFLNKRMSVLKIAKHLNLGANAIRTFLTRKNIPTGLNKRIKSNKETNKKYTKELIEKIEKLTVGGYSLDYISNETGLSKNKISYIKKYYSLSKYIKKEITFNKEEIKKLYFEDKLTYKRIAEIYNTSFYQISKFIGENFGRKKIRRINYDILYDLYVNKKMKKIDIAKHLGMNYSYICDVINKKILMRNLETNSVYFDIIMKNK